MIGAVADGMINQIMRILFSLPIILISTNFKQILIEENHTIVIVLIIKF